MRNGTDTLIAGVVAAVLLPIMALGLKMGLFAAVLVAIAVFFTLRSSLRKGARSRTRQIEGTPAVEPEPVTDAQQDTAQALIEEGRAALARLRAAGRNLVDKGLNDDAKRLYQTADRLLLDVEADPARAMSVRRFITFYLPNAASVAEGWRQLEGRALSSPERLTQTKETFAALNEAADRYAQALVQPQIEHLDLDLRVLKDALKHDLERLP